jgi:hypothetical protein
VAVCYARGILEVLLVGAAIGQKRKLQTLSNSGRSSTFCASGCWSCYTSTAMMPSKQGNGFRPETTCIDTNSYTDPAGPFDTC